MEVVDSFCRCPGGPASHEKSKEKLRLFSRKKSHSKFCHKCGLPPLENIAKRPPMPDPPRESPEDPEDHIYSEIEPPFSSSDGSSSPPAIVVTTVKSQRVPCDCPKCRDPEKLTVELLPMDTQMTLQSMMQGSTLMCTLL